MQTEAKICQIIFLCLLKKIGLFKIFRLFIAVNVFHGIIDPPQGIKISLAALGSYFLPG
jgi:hypothetical protein